jgi:adenosylcobinamide kinase / adenosylcobinamide-phosphate guanylyltransferase
VRWGPPYRRVLVLGGARSGKSAFAERLAATLGEPVLFVATATPDDAEMAERIRRHRERRPRGWRTVEAPLRPAEAVPDELGEARTVLVEDLTLLLSNVMSDPAHCEPADEQDAIDALAAEQAVAAELESLLQVPAHMVLVSNEVGMGLVPLYPLGRAFRDALGRINQLAAARADDVFLLVAGVPLRVKPAQSVG